MPKDWRPTGRGGWCPGSLLPDDEYFLDYIPGYSIDDEELEEPRPQEVPLPGDPQDFFEAALQDPGVAAKLEQKEDHACGRGIRVP
ncbi:MAG: hypothetical protein ABEK00_03870 [Candidatus Nanohaloarchaea archaeon]